MRQQDTRWYIVVPLKTSAFSKDQLMHFVIMEWFTGSGLDPVFVGMARNEYIAFFFGMILICDKLWPYVFDVQLQRS